MRTPTTSEIRTAIQVLKRLGEHINHNTANVIIDLPETRFGDHVAARAKVVSIDQITRIHTVATQLEKWRDDLLQQRRQSVSHHV
ncbi:MAG TPA: hypothetical protein PLV05_03055 [Verrucomicrobiota bacterium]|mgnify:FL=1|nr:hypothetical protein [Verrucomicrobiota bacterium]HRR63946.1 hypothetical protein [Candidatus Paceibacterota bacterium]HOM44494.1 hypothetical protein [Verrucomicrobiota bacterium]HOQ54900.1 hypothetical protein [Verrucomicrobiota bacterium]HPC52059.1 hypothetical protein [Verrucomicrobiota bacterium]